MKNQAKMKNRTAELKIKTKLFKAKIAFGSHETTALTDT